MYPFTRRLWMRFELLSVGWIYAVAVLMFAQIFMIVLQDRLGPTFFMGNRVRASFIPPVMLH